MLRIGMYSRNEYLQVLKQCYFKAESKKQKYQILNEYCRNTGQPRKYVTTKIHKADLRLRPRQRKKRKQIYDSQVRGDLSKIWEIVDYPCGQSLKPLLKAETDRLRKLAEMQISDEVVYGIAAIL